MLERAPEVEEKLVEGGFTERTKLELILLLRDIVGVAAVASVLLPFVTSDPGLANQDYPVKHLGLSFDDLEAKLKQYEKLPPRLGESGMLGASERGAAGAAGLSARFPRTSVLLDLNSKAMDAMRRQSLLTIADSSNIWVNHKGKPMPKEGNIWNEKGSVVLNSVGGKEVVIAGTLNQLLTHFTSAKASTTMIGGTSAMAGSDFSSTFMITFQTFTTPEIFFDKMRERYQVPDCPEFLFMDEQEYEREYKKPIKIRVCNIL